MNDVEFEIKMRPAVVSDALFIARGFHMAMLYDDATEERIRHFADVVCLREDVLYSWCNTLIAEADGVPVGMVTSYDGRNYRAMREVTMQLVKEHMHIEFPGMEDEALPGEYYIDSLAVMPQYRGKGIGKRLLQYAIEQGQSKGLRITIAVDPDNPRAHKLYESFGFQDAGTLYIFGHDYTKMMM